MAAPDTQSRPRPGEVWISRPPDLLLARIVEVDERLDPARISYELHDKYGSVLKGITYAPLDHRWWRLFQPTRRRYG